MTSKFERYIDKKGLRKTVPRLINSLSSSVEIWLPFPGTNSYNKEAKEIVFNPDPVYTTEYIIIMEVKYAEWEILNQVLNLHVSVLVENTARKLFFSERKQSVGGKHRPKITLFREKAVNSI